MALRIKESFDKLSDNDLRKAMARSMHSLSEFHRHFSESENYHEIQLDSTEDLYYLLQESLRRNWRLLENKEFQSSEKIEDIKNPVKKSLANDLNDDSRNSQRNYFLKNEYRWYMIWLNNLFQERLSTLIDENNSVLNLVDLDSLHYDNEVNPFCKILTSTVLADVTEISLDAESISPRLYDDLIQPIALALTKVKKISITEPNSQLLSFLNAAFPNITELSIQKVNPNNNDRKRQIITDIFSFKHLTKLIFSETWWLRLRVIWSIQDDHIFKARKEEYSLEVDASVIS